MYIFIYLFIYLFFYMANLGVIQGLYRESDEGSLLGTGLLIA